MKTSTITYKEDRKMIFKTLVIVLLICIWAEIGRDK